MNTRPLLAAALAVLSLLTACGGGQADEGAAQVRTRAASVGDAVAAPAIGGIGGSGLVGDSVGGVSGSGSAAPAIGGIGGSGLTIESVGVAQPAIGGIGGSGAPALATACGVAGVNVTLAAVRLNRSATAAAGDEGWFDVVLHAPLRVNLLALSTGAALPLAAPGLPDGTYLQARLLLVPNDAATPLANAVVGPAGVESALAAPGAAQGGLRLASDITVSGGRVSGSWPASAVCAAIAPVAAATY